MGSKLELTNTALFEQATTIYLVTQPGISELRNSSRLIAQYAGTVDSKLEIVLNRYQSRGMLVSEQQIAKVLTKPARWKVPNDSAGVQRMQGNVASVEQADSSLSAVTEQMARFACGLPDAPARKKRFSLKNFAEVFRQRCHPPRSLCVLRSQLRRPFLLGAIWSRRRQRPMPRQG